MDRREEILNLMKTLGISINNLASQLGLRTNTLNYILHDSSALDDELYTQIKDVLNNYQYELRFFDETEDDTLDLFDEDEQHQFIGERIRLFARRKFGTLKKLAAAMEISPQQLQQYISGKREPGSRILMKFLKLGCDLNWLLGGRESNESYRIQKLETRIKEFTKALEGISEKINDLLRNQNR
ncbi:helix-turn-helix domain-containing protein [Melioribacter sp. OK-6-Me]|uniref:helix-turn-helix domain-containing protein n=1 Tax=unclassified Melioribacter TaxID=2627329 RepID=UPI003ED8E444